jgi:hypothetical protein
MDAFDHCQYAAVQDLRQLKPAFCIVRNRLTISGFSFKLALAFGRESNEVLVFQ